MHPQLRHLLVAGVAHLGRSLQRAWHEAPAAPHAVRHGLEIALVPSPLVRRLRRGFLVGQAAFALELLLLGHGAAAVLVLSLAMAPGLQQRMPRLAVSRAPRRLLVAADGRLHLLGVGGDVEPVRLQGSSLRLGPWLLLSLRGEGRVHRLLLGPDNVPPALLAALRRRMLRIDQGAESVAPGLARGLSPGMSPDDSRRS